MKNKYRAYEEMFREFKKIKPPMFNGEIEQGEEVESWLSEMKKHFQIYNYSDELKAKMTIYNLTKKADIWWKDINKVKRIKIRNLIKKSLKPLLTNVREKIWNFLAINLTFQVKSQLKIIENNKSQVKAVTIIKRKINTDFMRKYLGSLRKLNHPCSMGKLRSAKRQRPGCSE